MANNNNNNNNNNQRMNEHVEFSVKAEEDLYLEGTETTIRRVTADTNYSCLMLKTQRFSSLFRHYAKYHGLRKDELEYYFSNLLQNEDTPESVHLQRGDTIMVRKRRKAELPKITANDEEYFKDMTELLHDQEHMDAVFVLKNNNNNNIQIRAHKSILTARNEYFKALFRKQHQSLSSFQESSTITVVEPEIGKLHLEYILEFIYTNRIQSIGKIATDDLLIMLHLADKWLLTSLKRLLEHQLASSNHLNMSTAARLYAAATRDMNGLTYLKSACLEFILQNLRELSENPEWIAELKSNAELCLPVLSAAADLIHSSNPTTTATTTTTTTATASSSGRPHKKQRVDRGNNPVPNAALSSPKVADIL